MGASAAFRCVHSNFGRLKFRRSDGRGGSRPTQLPPRVCYTLSLNSHKHIIGVEALSDADGCEGIVMELAMCDLNQAFLGTSQKSFSVSQQIG